jgi:hypothetical protein
MVLRSKSVKAEFGLMKWDVRSTWHPGGTVIVADESIGID